MTINKLPEFAKDGQKNTDDLVLTDGFPVLKKPARQWFNWLFNTLTSKVNEIIDADFIPKADIVNNLTTDDAKKPVSSKQAKNLQDNKLDKTANAVSSSKLETVRTVSFSGAATGSFSYDGSSNSSAILTLANSGVTANTYGASLKIPIITVNAKGLITGVSEQNIPIVDNLTTDDASKPLSAAQGKILNDQKLNKDENAATATKLQTARTIGGVSFDGSANINLPGVNTAGNQNTSGNAASATDCSRSVIAGNGLSGGGALTSDRTVTLGTPGNITATSTNSVTEASHTHNLDVNSLPFLGTGINKRKSIISGTTYTNTGNRPIFVTCSMSGSSSNAASATLGGRLIFSTNSSNQYSQSFVVGVGVSYSFTGNALVCEEYS